MGDRLAEISGLLLLVLLLVNALTALVSLENFAFSLAVKSNQ